MTKQQIYKHIRELHNSAEELRARIEELHTDMQTFWTNKTEHWHESEAGETFDEHLQRVESAMNQASDAAGELESAQGG